MTTVTSNDVLSTAQNDCAIQSDGAGSQVIEDLNSTLGQIAQCLQSENPQEVIPSLIELLVHLKAQVASLMAESKELRSLLVEAKAELAIEKSIEELEKLESSKSEGILGKLQAIFQPLLLAFSALAVIVAPTPITVGLLLFSVAMYADEEIASATGNDSLLTTMVSKLESGLSEILPPNVAQILSPIIVVFSMVVISVLAAKGGMSMAGKFGNFPGVQQLQNFVASKLGNVLSDPVATKQLAQKLTNQAVLAGAVAEQGVVVANSTFQYQTAKLQHTIDILDADISMLENMSLLLENVLNGFMDDYQQSKSWSVS